MYPPTYQPSYMKHPFACFGNSAISHTQMTCQLASGANTEQYNRGGRLLCCRGVLCIFLLTAGRLLRILPIFAKNGATGRQYEKSVFSHYYGITKGLFGTPWHTPPHGTHHGGPSSTPMSKPHGAFGATDNIESLFKVFFRRIKYEQAS